MAQTTVPQKKKKKTDVLLIFSGYYDQHLLSVGTKS
jgi:hypothetical protein